MTEEERKNDGLETVWIEVEGLKHENEVLKRGLESRDATIARLEQTVTAKDSELTTLRQAVAKSEKSLGEVSQTLVQAVASYKEQAVKANPEILPELITGDTVAAVNQSLENARNLVERVKRGVEAETSRTRVPFGAPPRTPPDLSALSPREKIQYAIGKNTKS